MATEIHENGNQVNPGDTVWSPIGEMVVLGVLGERIAVRDPHTGLEYLVTPDFVGCYEEEVA